MDSNKKSFFKPCLRFQYSCRSKNKQIPQQILLVLETYYPDRDSAENLYLVEDKVRALELETDPENPLNRSIFLN